MTFIDDTIVYVNGLVNYNKNDLVDLASLITNYKAEYLSVIPESKRNEYYYNLLDNLFTACKDYLNALDVMIRLKSSNTPYSLLFQILIESTFERYTRDFLFADFIFFSNIRSLEEFKNLGTNFKLFEKHNASYYLKLVLKAYELSKRNLLPDTTLIHLIRFCCCLSEDNLWRTNLTRGDISLIKKTPLG